MRTIILSGGRASLVDDEDYALVNAFKWYLLKGKYAQATTHVIENGKRIKRHIRMHRLIMGLSLGDGCQVDHVNGDGLDNRRSNLRLTDSKGNNRNSRAWGSTSQYRGVVYIPKHDYWRAWVAPEDAPPFIKFFRTEREAALAVDHQARIVFGEFARLNFPDIVLDKPPTPLSRRHSPPRSNTGYRGVCKEGRGNRSFFSAKFNRKLIGYFDSPEEAAKARDKAAFAEHGRDCYLNFPDEFPDEP